MEVLSVVCLVMLFLCGLINIFIEAYRLINKFNKYNRDEQLRAQINANRFLNLRAENRGLRVRFNNRRPNPPQYADNVN